MQYVGYSFFFCRCLPWNEIKGSLLEFLLFEYISNAIILKYVDTLKIVFVPSSRSFQFSSCFVLYWNKYHFYICIEFWVIIYLLEYIFVLEEIIGNIDGRNLLNLMSCKFSFSYKKETNCKVDAINCPQNISWVTDLQICILPYFIVVKERDE